MLGYRYLVPTAHPLASKAEIAKSLLFTNLSSAEIAKHTGLTVEQIEQLRRETS
jgi:ribosomal protein L10